jgi:hypothetical protein
VCYSAFLAEIPVIIFCHIFTFYTYETVADVRGMRESECSPMSLTEPLQNPQGSSPQHGQPHSHMWSAGAPHKHFRFCRSDSKSFIEYEKSTDVIFSGFTRFCLSRSSRTVSLSSSLICLAKNAR